MTLLECIICSCVCAFQLQYLVHLKEMLLSFGGHDLLLSNFYFNIIYNQRQHQITIIL